MNAELTIQKMKSVSSKNLRSVLAFFALAGMIFCSTACDIDTSEQKNIKYVLDSDFKLRGNTTASSYYYAMSKIDSSNCPQDFTEAWKAHTAAWKKLANFEEKRAEVEAEVLLYDLFFLGLGSTAKDIALQQVLTEIEISYENVLLCAEKYGIDTSKYREP